MTYLAHYLGTFKNTLYLMKYLDSNSQRCVILKLEDQYISIRKIQYYCIEIDVIMMLLIMKTYTQIKN